MLDLDSVAAGQQQGQGLLDEGYFVQLLQLVLGPFFAGHGHKVEQIARYIQVAIDIVPQQIFISRTSQQGTDGARRVHCQVKVGIDIPAQRDHGTVPESNGEPGIEQFACLFEKATGGL